MLKLKPKLRLSYLATSRMKATIELVIKMECK